MSEPAARAAVDLALRPAESEDLPAVAEVYLRSRGAAERVGTMPPGVHTDDETRAWVRAWDLDEPGREVWLAELDDVPVGFANLTATFLDGLYVVPEATRRGVATALLELARARRPDGFGLWVFEVNAPARALYARHGLVEVERTDGAENEERAPDLRLDWPAPDPAPEVRGSALRVVSEAPARLP